MTRRVPKQKIIRFDNPKYSNRDKDIWPWIVAQGKHVTRSLHLLINVAQAKNGNVDYTKAVIQRAINNQSQSMPKHNKRKDNSSSKHTSSATNTKETRQKARNSSISKSSKSNGPKKMTRTQLKNAFLS